WLASRLPAPISNGAASPTRSGAHPGAVAATSTTAPNQVPALRTTGTAVGRAGRPKVRTQRFGRAADERAVHGETNAWVSSSSLVALNLLGSAARRLARARAPAVPSALEPIGLAVPALGIEDGCVALEGAGL